LKKSTLRLLNASVIFTPSSRNTRSSGAGRKSGTTLGLPKGSSVYLIFALIELLTLSPIAGANDTNDARPVGEPDGDYATANRAKAEVALFAGAMRRILGDHPLRVSKCELRDGETNAVLKLILAVLCRVPLESGFGQTILYLNQTKSHT
jgi:hypothetical protein